MNAVAPGDVSGWFLGKLQLQKVYRDSLEAKEEETYPLLYRKDNRSRFGSLASPA